MARHGSTFEPTAAARVELRRASRVRTDGPIERTTASLGLWPWALLAAHDGLAVERFCELAGVDESALRDPAVRFAQPVCDHLAQLAYASFGPGAAMQAARLVEAGHFQLLELIARSVPTVRDGIEQGCRYFPLLHDGGHLSCEALPAGLVALRWDPPVAYPVHHGYVQLTFAVAILGIRRETARPEATPDEVWFRHAAPDDPMLHASVLGVAPRFGMPEDHVVFGAGVAALRLSRANPAVHDAAAACGAAALDE